MAVETEAHVKAIGPPNDGHLTDVTVAGLTTHSSGGHVGAVAEVHKIGLIAGFDPMQGLAFIPELNQQVYIILPLCARDLDVLVAAHTFLGRRHTSHRAVEHPRVTENARHASRNVLLMAKRQGVTGGGSRRRPILPGEDESGKE